MSVVLQVNFNWDAPEEIASGTVDAASEFVNLPGLQWKIWLRDPESKTSGGIYLFETLEAAEAWQTTLVLRLKSRDKVSNVTTHIFNVTEAPSRITRAPLDVPAPTKL